MGESDAGFSSYTPADTARDIVALLSLRGGRNYVLVGCSMCAASVVLAATLAPAQVSGIYLISAFAWDHPMPLGVPTLLSLLITSCTGPAFWTGYYKSLFTLSSTAPVPDLDQHIAALGRNLSQGGRIAALRGHVFASKAECATKIPDVVRCGIPVGCVYGSMDPDFSPPRGVEEEVRQMKAKFPHMRHEVCVVNGAGHYPHVEAPRQVANDLIAFINSLSQEM